MLQPVKPIDIELSDPPTDIESLDGYVTVKGLVRLHGVPLGYVQLPIVNGRCPATMVRKTILEQHSWPIIRYLLNNLLTVNPDRPDGWTIADLLDTPPPAKDQAELPLVTVAVCTRDRPNELALCLDAFGRLDYPNLDIVIVDNAPSNDATQQLVTSCYPEMRYVREPRPGLDWARNRAIIEARGEIIAYTDDDVIVDPGWVTALVDIFVENPEVMAVTGLVAPYELETEPQLLFELYGGFGRGFIRHWYHVDHRRRGRAARLHGGTGKFGTGANMAYRRSVFEQIGYFDPALDVGTVTNGGGDLEMFFRILKEGHVLVYEPKAIVRHRHRRDYAKLQTQIANNGIGFYAYIVRSMLAYPQERRAFIRLGWWWLRWWNIRRLLLSFIYPPRLPRDLIWVELKGSLIGLGRYQKAKHQAAQIAQSFEPLPYAIEPKQPEKTEKHSHKFEQSIDVRTVELSQPLAPLTQLDNYQGVRIFVTWKGRPLGIINILNEGNSISATRLREAIVDSFGVKLLDPSRNQDKDIIWSEILAALKRRYMPPPEVEKKIPSTRPGLPAHIPVSVVVATHDRTNDLRECLQSLVSQETSQPVEIIVVDNNPASGLTPPVVAQFPGVKLITEFRKGLSYARNAGIAASKGEIILATDDDVIASPQWLENLVAPFARPDIMIVTGNTLPIDLSTPAQRLFERYGGLGRGFAPIEADREWFESFQFQAVPTWKLGATANAAFRASIFHHPEIGLLDEALGVGTPTGCSEDTYLFYQVLKAGYTLVYEPTAYVWHKHRRDMQALRRQIYDYSKGHVAYHLTTLFQDHDLRALLQITFQIPKWHIQRLFWHLKAWLRRTKREYPFSLTLLEIGGNLAGPWALWQSRRRVKREGRSQPYIPPSRREVKQEPPAERPNLQPRYGASH